MYGSGKRSILNLICNRNGSNGCSNPITADVLGNYHLYATASTKYILRIYRSQAQTNPMVASIAGLLQIPLLW